MKKIPRTVVTLLLAIAVVGCGQPAGGGASVGVQTSPSPTVSSPSPSGQAVPMYWASYQLSQEPHYRLIFEGGSESLKPSSLRITDQSGKSVAAADTVPAASDPLRLCGATRQSSPQVYGPVRATLIVDENLFRDFSFRRAADFRVEVQIGALWLPAALTNLCHAQG